MLNETVKNMELVILEMENQFIDNTENYKALKTLSNSYYTLLKQLFMNPNDLKDIDNMTNLEYQEQTLDKLKTRLETKSIPELLSLGEYVMVNHITTTTTKLYDSIRDLEFLLDKYVYEYHRKKVAIVSFDKNRAIKMMDKLVEKTNEKIIHNEINYKSSVIKTKSYTFSSFEYSDRLLGRRFDEIYIENDFKGNLEVQSLVKDKNNITYFELS